MYFFFSFNIFLLFFFFFFFNDTATTEIYTLSLHDALPIPLKDPSGFWIGTALEPYGIVYHPRLIRRLGVPEPKDWEDLLHPKLKGNVAQCAPTRSSSSH